MLSKSQVKFINSLQQKKYRVEHQSFVAEGAKIVPELLRSTIVVKQIFGTADFFEKNTLPKDVECIEVKAAELERISFLTTPNEVLAVCEYPIFKLDIPSLKNNLTIVLDDIKDPGNLGTIIRIADWFGINQLICSKETADAYNSKVIQATMGSIARVKIHYTDLIEFFKVNDATIQLPVYGAILDGKNIYSETLSKNGLIVIGNESRGINEDLLSYINHKISIPSFSYTTTKGKAESLNAAIATSIICSEFRRRS